MSYNGYTNYETWNIMLWIDNDEYLSIVLREEVSNIENSEAAGYLEYYFDEHNPLKDQNSTYTDLLNSALSEVNWWEVAKILKEEG